MGFCLSDQSYRAHFLQRLESGSPLLAPISRASFSKRRDRRVSKCPAFVSTGQSRRTFCHRLSSQPIRRCPRARCELIRLPLSIITLRLNPTTYSNKEPHLTSTRLRTTSGPSNYTKRNRLRPIAISLRSCLPFAGDISTATYESSARPWATFPDQPSRCCPGQSASHRGDSSPPPSVPRSQSPLLPLPRGKSRRQSLFLECAHTTRRSSTTTRTRGILAAWTRTTRMWLPVSSVHRHGRSIWVIFALRWAVYIIQSDCVDVGWDGLCRSFRGLAPSPSPELTQLQRRCHEAPDQGRPRHRPNHEGGFQDFRLWLCQWVVPRIALHYPFRKHRRLAPRTPTNMPSRLIILHDGAHLRHDPRGGRQGQEHPHRPGAVPAARQAPLQHVGRGRHQVRHRQLLHQEPLGEEDWFERHGDEDAQWRCCRFGVYVEWR